jgi:hypothetical protein
MLNVAVFAPAATVTFAGTVVTPSPPERDTTAPPDGAAPVSVTVPITGLPPTTLLGLSEIEPIATPPVEGLTVIVAVLLLPLKVAVIVEVPGDIAETENVAVVAAALTVTDIWTVATLALLLESATVAPCAVAAAVSVTVPCAVVPTGVFEGFRVTPETAGLVVGCVGVSDPQ